MLLTPTSAKPCACARSITARVAWYIASIPLWLPPSNSTDTLVSLMTRIGRRGAVKRGWSATLSSFGRPEYS